MPCGQTKTTCWTNYPRNFASVNALSIRQIYDDLMPKLHMNKPKNARIIIKIGMRTRYFCTFPPIFEDRASAKNALYTLVH